mmetsp:Transcript_23334/g.59577  ORF Transcript_23334/g.59577 Transcript_23334/m.59577 type:complete len:87 (+) Transcript_23334:260-520(+)
MAVRAVAIIAAGCRCPLLKWRRQDSARHGALLVLQLQLKLLLLQKCKLPRKTHTTSTNNAIMARRHGVRAEGLRIERDGSIAKGWL